ncbi:glycosyltransferase [Saccharibacillus sp. CPCC 101409]|uniref:glycosyltransferase n=1 Tax=Saccharibacillus sp. CPCC 101409 TaxID=3058041 RepID=UPI002674143A|nr:glycosyltransferase [Saccharibacillus sp. CPCC 101409]MDO3412078.1 glycosyltransferase [Saccharibacillus sp. CPCC 101409]
MKKTISLCMIVKNEEQYLEKCLKSAKPFVDQIVIVDTGSVDNTLDIARRYNSEIHHFEWINDFSAARNEAIKHATMDYILVLDADEYLTDEADLQSDLADGKDYYFIKIHNLLSRDLAINHLAIRLFINHKGLRYQYRLHEHLNTMETKGLEAGYADSLIMHAGYTDEMMQDRDKAQRNMPLMLKEVEENPNAYNLFNMGRMYMWLGEHEKAIDYLKRAYPLSKGLSNAPELISTLCKSLGELERYEEALTILSDAVNVFQNEVDLLHLQALLFEKAGYKKDAIETMNVCLELGDQGITVAEGYGSYIAHFRLAEWYEEKYKLLESYEHITQAMKQKKDFTQGLYKYLSIVKKANVPLEDVKGSISRFFSINNLENLKKILEIFYAAKHPLLSAYLKDYNLQVEPYVHAVGAQYSKNYKQARDIWLGLEQVSPINEVDIVLLAFILQEESLIEKVIPSMNYSINEKKLLKRVVDRTSKPEGKITTTVEKLLLEMATGLIELQEYNAFEEMLQWIWVCSPKAKYEMCKRLIAYGFTEIAIDLLLQIFKEQPRNPNVIELLGDVCDHVDYQEDSLLFYTKLIEIKPSYLAYEKLYDLYEKMGKKSEAKNLKQLIHYEYPLSLWASE